MKRILFSLAAVSAFVHMPALARDRSAALEAASEAFAELQFETSLDALEEALALRGNTQPDLLRIYTLRAFSFLSLGRSAEAEQSFEALLSIDPSYRLPRDTSPRFLEPFLRKVRQGVTGLSVELQVLPRAAASRAPLLSVRVKDDPARLIQKVRVRFRPRGAPSFSSAEFRVSPSAEAQVFALSLISLAPGQTLELQWFGEVLNVADGVLSSRGAAERPLLSTVRAPRAALAATELPQRANTIAAALSTPWNKRWWVWALVGSAVAVAGGSVAYLTLVGSPPDHRDFTIEVQ